MAARSASVQCDEYSRSVQDLLSGAKRDHRRSAEFGDRRSNLRNLRMAEVKGPRGFAIQLEK